MNTWKTANAVVRHLEAATPGVRTYEGGLQLLEDLEDLEDLEAEPRVRDDVGGWAW